VCAFQHAWCWPVTDGYTFKHGIAQRSNWNVEAAVSAFLESGGAASPIRAGGGGLAGPRRRTEPRSDYEDDYAAAAAAMSPSGVRKADDHKIEKLVDDNRTYGVQQPHASAFRNFASERQGGRRRKGGANMDLATLMRPPTEIIFPGTLDQVCMPPCKHP
jgi:hypothetical protein